MLPVDVQAGVGLVAEEQSVLALQCSLEPAGPCTVAREQIDDDHCSLPLLVEDRLDWCIYRQSAVSQQLAVQLNRRKLGQEAATGHDVIDLNALALPRIEKHRITSLDVDCRHREANVATVQPTKVYGPAKEFYGGLQIIEAMRATSSHMPW
jgi:hypothetical protein